MSRKTILPVSKRRWLVDGDWFVVRLDGLLVILLVVLLVDGVEILAKFPSTFSFIVTVFQHLTLEQTKGG
jgi:hypothetical protein